MAYNTNEERLVVKGSERITHDLQVNGDVYVLGTIEGDLNANNVSSINVVSNSGDFDNLSVNNVAINGNVGNNGQVLGIVNGKSEWMDIPEQVDADNFSVNNLYVNNIARVNNYDVTAYTVIAEDDYNNLTEAEKLRPVFYLTKPRGNLYFQEYGYSPKILPPQILSVYVNLFYTDNNITVHHLDLNVNDVVENLTNCNIYGIRDHGIWDNAANVSINTLGDMISTNAQTLYVYDASNMYLGCTKLTDTFICNSSLITNAPEGYDPMIACVNMSSTFYGCSNFNQPITIPDSVVNMYGTFIDCSNFNQPITIPDSVVNISRMLLVVPSGFWPPASIFNSPVVIGNNVVDMSGTFANCGYFNQPITIGNNVVNMLRTFENCKNFSQPLIIPDSVVDLNDTFLYSGFNSPITIGNNVVNMYGTFASSGFNQPLNIPDSVTSISKMLYGCSRFNQSITIGNNVVDMSGTFQNCYYFNQPITIGNNVVNMSSTFQHCFGFNQPLVIPDSVTEMVGTLSFWYDSEGAPYDSNFNQPITIGNNVVNMVHTFLRCVNFNQPITIPDSVVNMYGTFSGCTSFNQPITIPDSVENMGVTFSDCTTLEASTVPIHISSSIALGDTTNYIYNMLVNGGCGITFDPSRILNDA